MKDRVNDFDEYLDDRENKEKMYYTNVPQDDDWLSVYGWFLPDI